MRRGIRHLAVSLVVTATVGCGTGGSPAPSPVGPPTGPSSALAGPPTPSRPPNAADATAFPLPQGSDEIELDPAWFAGVVIDHAYWPMAPGSRWVYRESDGEGGEQRVDVTVTSDTKLILGITATVVHDVVSTDGELVEDTYDWYAQDVFGNLWYLGEDTKEYENGEVVSTEGSWEAGVDGAQAGIILPADPEIGMTYRQEFYAGKAEDAAKILSVDEHVDVPIGSFDGCLLTRDFTPLSPDVIEEKYYAPGVGPVAVVQVSGGKSHEQLVSYEPGG